MCELQRECLPLLNEFVILENGLAAAGFSITRRHPDVQSPGKNNAIRVRLGENAEPVEVELLDADRVSSLFTFRNGNHNSFPYLQLKSPLLSVPTTEQWLDEFLTKWRCSSLAERRDTLRNLKKTYPIKAERWKTWPEPGLKNSLQARSKVLKKASLRDDAVGAVATVVLTVTDRFLDACADKLSFLTALTDRLLDAAEQGDFDTEAIRVAFCGEKKKQGNSIIVVGSPLYFDVTRDAFAVDVASPKHVGPLSEALQDDVNAATSRLGICALSGKKTRLHTGPFPHPSLPVLGQVYLFAKNEDIKAAHRYGRFADGGVSVGSDLVQRLAGALGEITAKHRKGQTWRTIPSEKPGKSDLLLAFVDHVLDIPLADAFGSDEEESEDDGKAEGQAAFLTRTKRIIDAVKAKVGADFRKTPVTACVLRKVDPGNTKVALHRAFTVGELYDAAVKWSDAQTNVPNWLKMPVPTKGTSMARQSPPHIAPLQLPGITRSLFIRGGRERARREPVGLTAQDALTLFLNDSGAERVGHAALSMVLERQGTLLTGYAHALRKDSGADKLKYALKFDRAAQTATLRTVTAFGLLLAKVGRRENYMTDVAFKLGQFLAVADTVHVGYCMDVRKGDVPPTLLGNSILSTAQSDPSKALAVLSRRWAPYGAWAKRPRVYEEAGRLIQSGNRGDQGRGWAIRKAISWGRRANELCQELHGQLPNKVNDEFRAELLLGYVAGLPPLTKDARTAEEQNGEDQQ